MKNNRYMAIFLIFISLSLPGMKQDNTSNVNEQSEDTYDCEKLKTQFPYFKNNKHKMNTTLKALLVRHLQPRKKDDAQIDNKLLSEQIACLVCFGADPNEIAARVEGDLVWDRSCPLEYAINTDNVQLASFLLKHKARTDFRTEENAPFIFQIRSVQMAKVLVPHMKTRDRITIDSNMSTGNTIVHTMLERRFEWKHRKNTDELLDYHLETADFANKANHDNEIPLHTIARHCSSYSVPEIQKRASLLIPKTRNINALNLQAKTPLDVMGSLKYPACAELMKIFKENGGKSTTNRM